MTEGFLALPLASLLAAGRGLRSALHASRGETTPVASPISKVGSPSLTYRGPPARGEALRDPRWHVGIVDFTSKGRSLKLCLKVSLSDFIGTETEQNQALKMVEAESLAACRLPRCAHFFTR